MAGSVRRWLALTFLFAGLTVLFPVATAQRMAAVRIHPAWGSYGVGETFAVEVWVEDVVGLYGVDVRLAFDPARLQVQESAVVPRTGLLAPPWMVFYNQVDNAAGKVWYVATMVNPQVPVSGSGAIVSFHFRVITKGLTTVEIAEQTLSNINGEVIPATISGARYGVGGRILLPLVVR